MAYWWEKKKEEDGAQQTSSQQTTDNVTSDSGYWWQEGNLSATVGNNITNRVNTWLKNHDNYVKNYQTRYGNRKFNYEDAYVKDSGSWLDTVSKQKRSFDEEADSILEYMDKNQRYLDKGWMKSVKDTLTSARGAQQSILDNTAADYEWWNGFGSEELVKAYGSAEDAYKTYQRYDGYNKKYSGQNYDAIQNAMAALEDGEEKRWLQNSQYDLYKNDRNYTSRAASGLKSFEAQQIAAREKEENTTWWEKALASFASTGDTSLPTGTMTSVIAAYRNDTSYREPTDQWSEGEKRHFGYLYSEDPQKAYAYGEQVNNYHNAEAERLQQEAIQASATQSFGSGALHTAGAIASAPFGIGLADFLDDLAEYAGRGTITIDGSTSPHEYFTAAQSGIANKLNDVSGTMDDDLWMIGGKGLGDLYNLGVSGAQSMASSKLYGLPAKAAGKAIGLTGKEILKYAGKEAAIPTLVQYFGIGAASSVDDALSRGVSPDRAILYGTIMGAMEGAAEALSVDNLIQGGSASTFRNLFLNSVNQGLGELQEEGMTSAADLFVDRWLAADKSKFSLAVKELMDKNPGVEEKDAKLKVMLDMAGDVAFDAIGGFATGFGNAALSGASSTFFDARKGYSENIDAMKQYGDKTDTLIQEGLESDKKSDSYRLAQKYQKQVQGKNGKDGKAMTGFQIRNLLAANQEQIAPKDIQKIQKAAEGRLTELGQTKDVQKTAALATKWATGGKLTSAEKTFLTTSEYGSRVANELHPKNIASGGFTADWAENIGTKQVNAAAYNKKAIEAKIKSIVEAMANLEDPNGYKSLESRVEAEEPVQVSDTGKSVIVGTDEEIDLTKPTFKEITEGGSVLEVNGKLVRADSIEYANEDLGYAVKNVGKIENITPEAAGAVVDLVDMSKPVVAQINGLDEAFTYGFNNYSEEDLKAGLFTGNLTEKQLNDAYKLGQYVRNKSDVDADAPVIKMRTAAEAKLTAEQKTAKLKARIESDDVEVYFEDGDTVVKIDDSVIMDAFDDSDGHRERRMAAVNIAKFLSKLGIGGKYYFYASYLSKTLKDKNGNALRVYKDADGNEVVAPNGMYKDADGSIHIDLNAGDEGQGTALFTLGHELTHFIKANSKSQFKVLGDLVTEAFDKTNMSMRKRVLAKQNFLESIRGEAVSYTEAYEEVVADAMSTMLSDGTFHEKIMEIKVKDRGLFDTIKRFFDKMIAKFKKVYAELDPDQQDARDIREMKDMFDRIQTAFAEALVEASDNFHAAMESVVETKAEPVVADEIITEGAVVTDGEGVRHSIRSMKHDIAEGKMFEDLKNICGWTDAQVATLRNQLEDLVAYMIPYRNILDMNETYGMEGRRFSPYKPNSDPLYKISMDFSTLCSKRLLTQYVIENLQLRENRPMSAEEQMAIRAMLNEYRKVEKGLQVACAMCYVEAARLKSPKQMQRWLDNPAPLLKDYFAKKNKAFNDSVKKAQSDFKESKGYDREAPKKDMKPADVKVLNQIGPKMRTQYKLSAEEQAIVEKAMSLPNSTYLTAGNLANLSETDPVIYDAYTAFVRTATRSKSLETDEPYYYGDSTRDNGNGIVVTDSFIEAVNRENGMRFSSWSDWRIQHLLDYITAVIDNSVRGAAMHGYTKFGDEVRVLGNTGMMFNMSGVAGTQTGINEDGSLNFSDTESIDVNEAIQLRNEFPETAGLQCIGVGDDHITALLRSDIIDYVIPYHVSGLNAALRRMADIHGWKDYTSTQHAAIDKSIKLENAVDKEHWHEEPVYSEFFVGYDTGMTGIEAMRASAEKYKQMCKDRGLTPKFNQFANEENYWKLLIDRKMINQQTGKLIQQKAVTPTFDFDAIKGVVDKFVDNYDAGLEKRALNHIVENWDTLPQRIKDLKKQGGTKAKKTKKAAATLANQTVAAQPKDGVKNSDRTELSPSEYNRLTSKKPINVTKQEFAMIKTQRKSKYSSLEESEIPIIDFFRIGDYRIINNGFIYYIRNSGSDSFSVVMKKKIVADARRITREVIEDENKRNDAATDPGAGQERGKRGPDRSRGKRSGNRRELSENDRGTVLSGEPQRDLHTGQGNADSRTVKRSERDSTGKQLTKEQQAYFANSMVRDADGRLMVMYHGTANGGAFTIFDGDQLGNEARTSQVGQGFYFTNAKAEAESYTTNVDIYGRSSKGKNPYLHEVYLNITNPFNVLEDTLNLDDVKSVYGDGTDDYFFDSWIPFYLNRKSVNGEVLTKAAVQAMSKDEKVSLYVDYLAQLGTKELLSNMVRAFPYGKQSELLAAMQNRLGYDGIVEEYAPSKYQYVAFSSEQIKNVDNTNPTDNPDIRYSDRNNAPTFYSQMGKVVEGMKQEKFGASSVISMLRGRGVKAEEIRWSGIHAFLDGKKSVTKAELLDFINGSMLQIEEQKLGNPQYTDEERKNLDLVEKDLYELTDRVADYWQIIYGTEMPLEAVADGETLYGSIKKALRRARTHPDISEIMEDADRYEEHENAIRELNRTLSSIREVEDIRDGIVIEAEKRGKAKWDEYKLGGGENYRELLFKIPGSDFSNYAMRAHWGEENKGVFAHARMQDFEVAGKKMLFIEEIQSDWHNQGQKYGYRKANEKTVAQLHKESNKAYEEFYNTVESMIDSNANWEDDDAIYYVHPVVVSEMFEGNESHFERYKFTNEQIETIRAMVAEETARKAAMKTAAPDGSVPDVPFKSNYHEYVLKRLLRMAAEEGYDSIGWTTADIQSDRWSDEYAEGYRIEYDQDIPKFLKKYGRQWGAEVGKADIQTKQLSQKQEADILFMADILEDGDSYIRDEKGIKEVWSMDITPAMKKSVLEEGQVLYSERGDGTSNRHLLANAFEGITKSSIEYEKIQEYKGHIQELNKLEAKLHQLNAEIRKIRFGTEGVRDANRLRQLEDEAKDTAKEINRHDRKLLSLEASAPLRKVIDRERKKEAQKTMDHVKQIQESKKIRAEQAELRRKIRKAVRDLDKILTRGNKKRNVKEDVQNVVTKALQAADILFTENYGSYDMLRNGIGADLSDAEEALVKTCAQMLKDLDKMPTDGYDNWQARQEAEKQLNTKMAKLKDVFIRERKRLNNTTVSSILGELADAYKSLENSELSYIQGAYMEPVYSFLKNLQSEVGGAIVQDMTKDQLESVYAAYRMVLTTVGKANNLFNEEIKMSREQMGNAVIQEIMAAGGNHGLWTKGEIARSQASWNNMKPIWVANRIGSESFGKLMQSLFEGQYNFAKDIEEARDFKQEMDKKYHPRNWDAEKQYEFESSTGREFSLNLQQIMSLYAFSKREQAYSHLLNGGFVFEGNSTVIVDKNGRKKTYIYNGATSYKLNEATLNEIINSLTVEQKAYVDEMQNYLSAVMGEKGNEVSMQLYGIKMFKEQFYFPLRSSGAYMEKAKEADLKKEQGQINLVNSGFTHSVKPQAKNPIILSGFLDVWAEHCNEMSMYHSMVLPMEDFRKVYNYSTVHDDKFDSASVYQTIQDAYGNAATSYIDQLYRELNSGATVDPRETSFKARISKFKKAAVMLSASVVVQQFSAIGRAYALIDPKFFIGTKVNSGTQMSAVDEMKKYAPVAIIKEIGGFDTGTKGSAKNYIMAEQYGKGERIKGLMKDEQYRGDIMGFLPAKADEKTWCAIWEAVKRETKAKNPNVDVKSEEFLKLAGERFSEIIEKTQVYDSVLARSANMRSKSALMSMATAFMAEPTTTVNLLEDAFRSGNKKHIARAFGAVAVSIVLNNALSSVVYAMRDDDEDETFIEKYFQSLASGMIDDINPMSYYPFLKDVHSLFQGYDVERADMSVIADLRDAMKKAVSVIGKYDPEMDDDELAAYWKDVNGVMMSLLDAGCSAFGVPLKNVRRDVSGLINAYTTVHTDLTKRDTTWMSFWDKVGAAAKDTIPIIAWTKDTPKAEILWEAIMAEDHKYVARIRSTYKTDDAYHNAVIKQLQENDPRIHEAAQARYDGDDEEYKRIFREIQDDFKKKGGIVGFNAIMSAVNNELSDIKKSESGDSASSDFSATDYVNAIIVEETAHAEAMREDIIASKVANGKTKEEAEEAFTKSVVNAIRTNYESGLLDEGDVEEMLVEYAGMDEWDAGNRTSYWAFCKKYPQYKDLSEERVGKYYDNADPAGIPIDVYFQYYSCTKDMETIYNKWGREVKSRRDQILEFIDSLPLTSRQKDVLYLDAGYKESTLWKAPW